jgi:iron(III) transport system permease protein
VTAERALAGPVPPLAWRRGLGPEHAVLGAAALALLILVVFPLAFLVWGSVTEGGRLTLEHFERAFTNRLYYRALQNSLVLGAATGALAIAIGLPLAWAVSRTDVPFKGFIRTVASVAYITPPFLSAIAYVNLFGPNAGIANLFAREFLGIGTLFNIFTLEGLIFVTALHSFPFVFFLAASALESVDASLEESAQVLGARRWRTVLSVTLPLVAPAVLSGALLAFVNAIALFGSQAIIGLPGRVFTLPTRIYALFNFPPEYGLASALSIVFVAITVLALYLQRRYLARRSFITVAGKGVRPQLVRLGGARWAMLAFAGLVFVFAVVAPYLTLLAVSLSASWGLAFWDNLTLANFQFVLFDYDVTRRALLNSFLLATAAATLAVLLGAFISWIDLRTSLPGRRVLDYVSLVPLGLPGIVVAVGLIQFWLRVPVPIYGTLLIILLAYVARFVPLGVRAANAALRQIDPALEETARVTGASWTRTMGSVTLPLIRPGLFAGWLLVFVPALQELSASILLFSSDSMTLAVAVYNLYETGYLEPVAALAMINVAIIGAAVALATRVSRIGAPAERPAVAAS